MGAPRTFSDFVSKKCFAVLSAACMAATRPFSEPADTFFSNSDISQSILQKLSRARISRAWQTRCCLARRLPRLPRWSRWAPGVARMLRRKRARRVRALAQLQLAQRQAPVAVRAPRRVSPMLLVVAEPHLGHSGFRWQCRKVEQC